MFIYDRFEAIRSSKGITKKHIAEALHRTPAVCQDWKYNKSTPSREQIAIIADILDTTPEYLCGESDIKNAPADPFGGDADALEVFSRYKELSEEQQKNIADTIKLYRQLNESNEKR